MNLQYLSESDLENLEWAIRFMRTYEKKQKRTITGDH